MLLCCALWFCYVCCWFVLLRDVLVFVFSDVFWFVLRCGCSAHCVLWMFVYICCANLFCAVLLRFVGGCWQISALCVLICWSLDAKLFETSQVSKTSPFNFEKPPHSMLENLPIQFSNTSQCSKILHVHYDLLCVLRCVGFLCAVLVCVGLD